MKFPDEDNWIPKTLLKNYIYNSIKNHGLPFVIKCIEDSVIELAKGVEELGKEIDIKEILKEQTKNKSSIKYTGIINISQLAEKRYGLEIKDGRTRCPIHEGKNKTSFMFNDQNNTFKCFSCGEHGNLIHFIKLMEDKKNE